MTLSEKQRLFVQLLPALINHAYSNGYELTLGDGYRDPRVFGLVGKKRGYGRARSNHKRRLAIDLNLFKDGEYLTDTADHRFLGEFWETLHPLCSWGGRFDDGNHYSLENNGMR